MILSIIMILAVIFFITVTHEAGHLLAGKAFGITAFSFSVGMGPKLYSKKYKGTEYALRLFPIGGSCELPAKDIDSLPVMKKLVIYLAGPAVNALTAVIFTIAVVILSGKGIGVLRDSLCHVFALPGKVFMELIHTTFSEFLNAGGIVKATAETDISAAIRENPVGSMLLLTAGFSSFVMAFNLLPLPPLDGGEALCTVLGHFFGKKEMLHRTVALLIWSAFIGLACLSVLGDAAYLIFRK